MKKTHITLSLLFFATALFSQTYRYSQTPFPSSDKIADVVYGTAPFLNFSYHNENNTSADDLVMDIYEPTGDTFTARPAIIFAHSGGFLTGDRNHDDMVALCDSFARKGYVTATIDYRQGFYPLANAEMHSTRGAYRGLQDGKAAIRFLRANASTYNIDPDKVYFVGSSAGAFIGLHSIYMDEPAEKPTAAEAVSYFEIIPPFFFNGPDLGDYDEGNHLSYSGEPDALVSMWGAVVDTNLITLTNNTPVFLIHGEDDSTVPFNLGYPFGVAIFPETFGSNLINDRLNNIGLTDKETYFVPGVVHEFYGVTNGAWNNGSGGNIYWDPVVTKTTDFLWKQHKPFADFSFLDNDLTVDFTDASTGALSWLWKFGDGNTSTQQNPSHTFSTYGSYHVQLYIENDILSWDTIGYQVELFAPLPVTWTTPLRAIYNNKQTDLTWKVAQQINNKKMVVEHSLDGVRFDAIGEIQGDGNLSSEKVFNFVHKNPTIGLHYYRIQQVDFDQQFAYSNIASIRVQEKAPIFSIFPNPAIEKTTVRLQGSVFTEIEFNTATGILVRSINLHQEETVVDVSDFAPGVYIVKEQGGKEVEKLIVGSR